MGSSDVTQGTDSRESAPIVDATIVAEVRAWMLNSLHEWRESGGSLVPTEPGVAQRALVRIRLRASVAALDQALGLQHDHTGHEREDQADLRRVVDAALAEARTAASTVPLDRVRGRLTVALGANRVAGVGVEIGNAELTRARLAEIEAALLDVFDLLGEGPVSFATGGA